MSTAPHYNICTDAFWRDPYPDFARMRKEAPIAYVPQLDATLFTKRDDIAVCEKNTEVFSSVQPTGLMTALMGQNMMRKDGDAHKYERRIYYRTMSPRVIDDVWTPVFRRHTDAILASLQPRREAELVRNFAMPCAAEALKSVTGLTNLRAEDMDRCSQGMIDGIANYSGDQKVEAHCRESIVCIDDAIDDMLPVIRSRPNLSLLSVMNDSGLPLESIKANLRLTISGGQNEPRNAIAGCIWALLTHPDQFALLRHGKASWRGVFAEYCRWISPIGMSPRRIAKKYTFGSVTFEPDERVFFMFGAANRDETHFPAAQKFAITRDTSKSVVFGAGPHFCAGAAASRALVADVALPKVFAQLKALHLTSAERVMPGGWAFRGLTQLDAAWQH